MVVNMRISRRTEIYVKAEVSDPDTMHFHQAMKVNYSTQFLKSVYNKFGYLLCKGGVELISTS